MTKANTAVATTENKVAVPSFIAAQAVAGTGAGNENVTSKDMQIPRLALLQDLSPEVSERKPEFIPGAKPGMLLNKMTGQLFDQLFVINLHYSHGYTVWKKRKLGGGMFGTFATEAEAVEALEEKKLELDSYDIMESPAHFVLILDDEGKPVMPAIIDFPSTKNRVSRSWNSLIATQGEQYDRFSWVWMLGSKVECNDQGQEYFNYKVDFLGAAPAELYAEAKKVYESVKGK
jgi:hypothetical protein